eukprot:51893_1
MEENSLLYKISNGIIITFLALTEASQDFVISTTHLYRIFASLPILKDILPNDGDDPHNDAVRPNHSDGYFYNHSLNVISKPKIMKYIKNKKDILDLLSQVNNDKNGRLRIAQYAHSYSNLFVEDLSMKNEDLPETENNYYIGLMLPESLIGINPKFIGLEQEYSDDLKRTFVKDYELIYINYIDEENEIIQIGGATPIWFYYNWCHKRLENGLNIPCEPTNVAQIHQTFVGVCAVSSHSGGITSSTICDRIVKMKIINSLGEEIEYNENNCDIKLIATHLGLLGIVTQIELRYDKMFYCNYETEMIEINKFFHDDKLFNNLVSTTDFNQFYWWPISEKIQYKVWRKTYDKTDVEFQPNEKTGNTQKLGIAVNELLAMFAPKLMGNGRQLSSKIFMETLTSIFDSFQQRKHTFKTYSCDAIHYTQGVQYNRAQDVSWIFPLNELLDENNQPILMNGHTVPDITKAKKLFVCAIDLYKDKIKNENFYPHTSGVEVRIFKGSEVSLSIGYGMKYCCAIEIGCDLFDDKYLNEFWKYSSELSNLWINISNEHDKQELKQNENEPVIYMRPHWAKSWEHIKLDTGMDIHQLFKNTFQDSIDKFNKIRKTCDPNDIFINSHLSKIFL